ncbi:MAG: oxygen-independent coproporphyrinogen III oxidase [Gammaproteobacteria bacterium]|nr:oxygen-independent coproporphyrinogen III oxidase [Gammaproteobacteria bacterium]
MIMNIVFDTDLINRYDNTGPRYTSYPTAVEFSEEFTEAHYRNAALETNEDPIPRPLSLYFHIPFCESVCFYCACNKVVTKNRSRAESYLGYLKKEIEFQSELFNHDRKVLQLHWGGGTPTYFNPTQITELMAHTRQQFDLLEDDSGDYSIEIDPRTAQADTIPFLRDMGFNRISFGIQDFDPTVQKAVNRVQSTEQVETLFMQARRASVRSINVDLIYGLPFQSVASFEKTLDHTIALSPDRLSIFNYAHLPRLFRPQRNINAEDLPSAAEKLAIFKMSIDKLVQAGYVYIGMDHFAKPDDELAIAQSEGKLFRNFQGYTLLGDCDLVGMGQSAISQVDDVYCQHVKTEDQYAAAIEAGQIGIQRGVALNFDDKIRRAVIMQLMCDFSLDIKKFESKSNILFSQYFNQELAKLKPMQEDGLVQITDTEITVAPSGRLLVRNICQIFDAYRQGTTNISYFSKTI